MYADLGVEVNTPSAPSNLGSVPRILSNPVGLWINGICETDAESCMAPHDERPMVDMEG